MSTELEEAKALLQKAHEVLAERWFINTEEDHYNDDDVISVDESIIEFLAKNPL